MMIYLAAQIARDRKERGVKLNHPEAVALITAALLEAARDGKSVSEATVTRVGSAALQQGAAPLRTQEHAIAVAASGVLLGASVLGARYPRAVAWPLTTFGAAVGGAGLLRAAQRRFSE